MKIFNKNKSLTIAELTELIILIISKLNIKFDDTDIPDVLTKHFK